MKRYMAWIVCLLSLLCLMSAGALVLVLSAIYRQPVKQDDASFLLTEAELGTCEIFVNNITCRDIHTVHQVKGEFCERITTLSAKLVPFRQTVWTELVLGEREDAFVRFKNDKVQYTISFLDTDKQLAWDYIHRDAPVVAVQKIEFDEEYGNPHIVWGWVCTMTAADFAELFDMVSSYSNV